MPVSSPSQFHQQLVTAFSLDEINQICFELHFNHEELGGDTLPISAKARRLVTFCASNQRLQALFDYVRLHRPNLYWPTDFTAADVPAWADSNQRLHQLRSLPEHFIGREAELAELCAAIRIGAQIGRASAITSNIQGLGGIGKTALAMAAAHALVPEFPDAQLVIELGANSSHPIEPTRALENALRAFYPPEQRLPEDVTQLRNLYVAALQGKRTLVILDDARDDDHIKLLLPPAGCAALITSRRSLSTGQPLRLGALQPTAAVALLRQLSPRLNESEAAALAKNCAYLPVALRVAGSFLKQRRAKPVSDYLGELAQHRLGRLGDEVSSVFASSFAALTEPQQAALCALSVMPADFDRAAALAVMGVSEGDGQPTADDFDELVASNLVDYNDETARIYLHDLMREFVQNSQGVHLERIVDMAFMYHARHFVEVAQICHNMCLQGGMNTFDGFNIFDRERTHIELAFDMLRALGQSDLLTKLISSIIGGGIAHIRFDSVTFTKWAQSQLEESKEIGNSNLICNSLINAGIAYARNAEPYKGLELLDQALILSRQIGNRECEAKALGNQGIVQHMLGKLDSAGDLHNRAFFVHKEIGNIKGASGDLINIGNIYFALKNSLKAIEFYKKAMPYALECHDIEMQAGILRSCGDARLQLNQTYEAEKAFKASLELFRLLGHGSEQMHCCMCLSFIYRSQGNLELCLDNAELALKSLGDHNTSQAAKIRGWIEEVKQGLVNKY